MLQLCCAVVAVPGAEAAKLQAAARLIAMILRSRKRSFTQLSVQHNLS